MDELPVKERIIEIAREKFFRNGFSKVTMDEIVSGLGISKKTLYEHFPSKDDLLDAVIEWQTIHVSAMVRRVVETDDDFISKIYNLYRTIGTMICQINNQFLVDLRRFRPDLWKKVDEMRAKTIDANISRMFDEGIRLGLVRSDVNRDIVLRMYMTAIQGIINPDVLIRSSFSAEQALQTILSVYFDGILTDSARNLLHAKFDSNHSMGKP